MTKVNLESEAEETVGATEEDILDVIESDEITSDLVEASKEANDAAEADQELTDLAEEVTETIGDIEEKLEDTADVEPEDVAVAQESLRHYKKMLGIKDEGTKISLESMRVDTKANLEGIKVELEGILDTIKDSAKKVWDWIVSIFKKIKELIIAGFNKLVSFFKNLAWKNKSEQLKVVDDIVKAMEDITKSDNTYINVALYKEAVDDFNDFEEELRAAAAEDLSNMVNTYAEIKKEGAAATAKSVDAYNMVSKRAKELAAKVKSGDDKKALLALPKPKEVTKKEEVKTVVNMIEPKAAEKRIADLLENKYCLLGLMHPAQTQSMYDYILTSLLKYGSETIKDLEAALNGNGKEVDISVMTAALYTKITSGLYTSRGISDYLMAMPFKIGYKLDSVYGRNIDPNDIILNIPRVGNTITCVLRNGEIVKTDVNLFTINKSFDISTIGFVYSASALEDALKEVSNFDKKYKSDLDKFYASLENIKKLMDNGKLANVKAGKPAASEDNDDYVSQFKFSANDVTKFCKDMVALTMMLIESYYELSSYLVYALGTVNKVTVNK
jgi:hypothetical protein